MKQRDDSRQLYDLAGLFDTVGFALFLINSVAAVIALLFPNFCPNILFWTQMFTAIGYVIDTVVTDGWLWFAAEQSRRIDCVSNGLGVNLSERKTEGYYNNSLPPSIQRYAANNFESAFYSKSTANAMIPGLVTKALIVILVFAFSLRSLDKEDMLLLIAQTCFSTVFLTDKVMAGIFCRRVTCIYDRFYTAFVTDGWSDTPQYLAKIISYSVEYESIKAFYKVRLSKRLFDKNRVVLDQKWKELSENIRILNDMGASASITLR